MQLTKLVLDIDVGRVARRIEFAPGTREATLTIPIDPDGAPEPREGAALRLGGFGDPVIPRPINRTGLVPAHR